jgi:hypothetical protein
MASNFDVLPGEDCRLLAVRREPVKGRGKHISEELDQITVHTDPFVFVRPQFLLPVRPEREGANRFRTDPSAGA